MDSIFELWPFVLFASQWWTSVSVGIILLFFFVVSRTSPWLPSREGLALEGHKIQNTTRFVIDHHVPFANIFTKYQSIRQGSLRTQRLSSYSSPQAPSLSNITCSFYRLYIFSQVLFSSYVTTGKRHSWEVWQVHPCYIENFQPTSINI